MSSIKAEQLLQSVLRHYYAEDTVPERLVLDYLASCIVPYLVNRDGERIPYPGEYIASDICFLQDAQGQPAAKWLPECAACCGSGKAHWQGQGSKVRTAMLCPDCGGAGSSADKEALLTDLGGYTLNDPMKVKGHFA